MLNLTLSDCVAANDPITATRLVFNRLELAAYNAFPRETELWHWYAHGRNLMQEIHADTCRGRR
jgi:hypothetical protein